VVVDAHRLVQFWYHVATLIICIYGNYSGVPGSEKCPVARIVRSTLPPFNHKQNYSNCITVTITYLVAWEQLFNIAAAAAVAAGPSTAVVIAAIAAAALRLALNFF